MVILRTFGILSLRYRRLLSLTVVYAIKPVARLSAFNDDFYDHQSVIALHSIVALEGGQVYPMSLGCVINLGTFI